MKTVEILVVEDNEDNSFLVSKILNFYGYKNVTMPLGQAAITYCESHTPDLILMDLSLPDIDGLEVTRLLRKMENFINTPIIAMTAHAMRGVRESTQEAGLTDFLSKPFNPQDLIKLIEKYLNIT